MSAHGATLARYEAEVSPRIVWQYFTVAGVRKLLATYAMVEWPSSPQPYVLGTAPRRVVMIAMSLMVGLYSPDIKCQDVQKRPERAASLAVYVETPGRLD